MHAWSVSPYRPSPRADLNVLKPTYRNSVKMSNPRGLGLTLSHFWAVDVFRILRSSNDVGIVMYTVHYTTIYPWFVSKTKPKMSV